MRFNKGHTLVEVIIAMTLLAIITSGISFTFIQARRYDMRQRLRARAYKKLDEVMQHPMYSVREYFSGHMKPGTVRILDTLLLEGGFTPHETRDDVPGILGYKVETVEPQYVYQGIRIPAKRLKMVLTYVVGGKTYSASLETILTYTNLRL